LKLLERILEVSSNENDIVLDAFCGCGTALVAAQKLKRQWIGIDISPTACRVMAKRLKKDCGLKEDEKLWAIGRGFVVRDLPKTEVELRKYPHLNLRTGLSWRSAAFQIKRKWATWESMAAFTQSEQCLRSVLVKRVRWNSWTYGTRCR
jgi:SAM-dependent methyltransferase